MRPTFLLVVLGLFWAQSAPASSLAKEPLLRVLRKASPAIRGCAGRHALPRGRYVVRLTILSGHARPVTFAEGPETTTPAGQRCVEAAFAALEYPELASLSDGRPETYRVAYPFVLAEPAHSSRDREGPVAAPRVRPRPARIGISSR